MLGWQIDCQADDWSRFRGPNGSGVDRSAAVPVDLRPESARWRATLAGSGHSSPVTGAGCVFVTSYVQNSGEASELTLECFNESTGERRWQWSTPLAVHPMHRLNNPAASTPAVDDRHVYLLATEPGHLYLIAIDHQGVEAWRRDFGEWVAQHGFGTSPIVADGKVVLVNSQEPVPERPEPTASRMIAVSAADGSDVWETPLAGGRACYAVPILADQPDGSRSLIGSTFAEGIFAVDLATGRMLWKQPCFEQRIVGSPILDGSLVLGNNGSGGGGNFLVAVGLDDHAVRYRLNQSIAYVPTLLAVDQRVYVVADNGVASCYSLDGGDPLWRQRLGDGFWSSPVSDGRNLFCVDKDGTVHVVAAKDQFELLGSFELGEPTQATPAIHNGQLLVRTARQLFCFGR
jgi:outer membrane protein assembly factor BamB